MTIEYFGGSECPRVLVTVDASELEGCGVSFSAMSLADPPTKRLLDSLLGMVTRMGLRTEGQRVRVDCAPTLRGGCALLISALQEREYVFSCTDDVISAYLAGVLPRGQITPAGEGWLLRAAEPAGDRARRLLREYCDPFDDQLL